MAEYIERGSAMTICERYVQHCFESNDLYGRDIADKIFDDISDLPFADVVKVVRCKDCKHKETLTDSMNKKISTICLLGEALHFVEDNHYCSYGERRCFDE